MAWRENQQFLAEGEYKSASFRGIPFWVEDYERDFGRRQSIQKFPGDRYTAVQDLGEDAPRFSVTAFITGNNYDDQRNDLEAALFKGGEGDLTLPWRSGVLKVTIVGRPQTTESKDERGRCSIRFECLVTAPPPAHFTPDSGQRVRDAADTGYVTTQEKFVDRFDTIGQPADRKLKITSAIDTVSTGLVKIQGTISAKINVITRGANQVNRLFGDVNSVIGLPLDLSDAIVNAVVTTYSSLRSTSILLQNVVTTWGRGGPIRILADQTFPFVSGFSPPTVNQNNSAGVTEQQNLDELYRLIRLAMMYETAYVLTLLPLESYDQANSIRRQYIETMDLLLVDAEGDEFEAISALNEAVSSHLSEVASTLPQLGTFAPRANLPALVVAHMVYGDATQEAEIVQRNDIVHPGFIPADEPLEVVLLDG